MGPPPERVTNDDNELTATLRPTQSRRPPKISRFFPQPLTDPSSCLPFQPISAQTFGLVQEQLAQDPFRLLIATIFLNRTRGHVALPVLFHVFECYPSIAAFATADPTELTELIRCLGFQHQRAKKCIALAQTWLACPPARGCRYRKLHYPNTNDGRDVRPDECLDDEDERVGWEIAHLPGVGAYSLDSWRIFCRDELRGVCKGKTTVASEDGRERGEGAANDSEEEAEFVPEWKKVLPKDKELRAYLTWMWLKEGYVWDWLTGEKTVAGEKVMRAAQRGGIAREVRDGNWMLETSPMKKAVNGFTMDG
ncbi:methyl-CpG-binding domain-containing protein 4 [Aspergillus saccharolyticus JOP 1030-1]|uniref:Methyl-CpG-binding domain-containing protein 4 n=1 Tax=Aspergillus saccharolyticus JOP 1030-1 TaxID=1450539 RepID=A0A318ZTV3_9EURO|nr:methyl-CpG-binding domain-containing protein 4 [Aspergillus saccharolyticus JOP 1030-1]PYH43518.1 methyl-CpG-binding domain-containing protein 4 [Aspergillus saccharolyticus JOP 1030-1]